MPQIPFPDVVFATVAKVRIFPELCKLLGDYFSKNLEPCHRPLGRSAPLGQRTLNFEPWTLNIELTHLPTYDICIFRFPEAEMY